MSPIAQGRLVIGPADPLARLGAALEPYVWLLKVTPVTIFGTEGTEWHAEVEADVKPTAEISAIPRWEGLSGHRKVLYARAEEAVSAAESAGWVHFRPPEIDIGGEMRWPDGTKKPPVILATARVRMWLLPTLRAL